MSGPYSIAERGVPELIPVLGSQPAGDVGHKPGSRLPLLSGRPAVTLATLKRAAAKKCTLLQIRLSVVVTGINYFYATCQCSFDRDYNSYDIYIFLIMCGIRKKVD